MRTYEQETTFVNTSYRPATSISPQVVEQRRVVDKERPGGGLATPRSLVSDDHFAVTFDRAGIGMIEVDGEGRFLRVNQHFIRLIGYGADELGGRTIFDADLTDDSPSDREQFARQVAGECNGYQIEKRFKRKDGSHFWAEVASSTVRDSDGNFLYAVRVQHDITHRKDVEQQLARRIEEQAALYEFTEQLQHAHTNDAVYGFALEAIQRALNCQRAAILRFDDVGVMRFVAAQGLSGEYCRAVEGHSPWTNDVVNPTLICVSDVAHSDFPDELKQVVAAEGIGALAFIPLCQGDRLTGKFMAYYDRPHTFTSDEIEVALAIARHLNFGIEQVRAERASWQLTSIVQSSDDAIISKDLHGIITTWNEGAERLFGYTSAEAIGKSVTLLIPEDRGDEEPGILARIRDGEPIHHYETIRRRKDGSLVDISLTVSPMRDRSGRIIGASKIARDITANKRAEAKLRASEQQLQELLAAIPAAIYTTDAKGRITYFNQAAVELAGRTPTIGTDEWCVTWKLYNPDGTPLPHSECPMAVALREGRAIRNAEAVAERPDGTRLPFIPYPTPLRDLDGNIVGAINMLVDISERKQAETQQRILLDELNHRVKNNMQMLQSLLFSAIRNTSNAEARQVLHDATSRIAAMTAAQRVLYGTFHATRFDSEAFLNAVCETVQQTLPRNVEIRCSAESFDLPNDVAMPLALILNELLTNAVKYGSGGRDNPAVHVGFTREGESCRLVVEDQGPGFDLEAVRARSSGLLLVQGLARQLRGSFDVSSNPSSQCAVRFSLN